MEKISTQRYAGCVIHSYTVFQIPGHSDLSHRTKYESSTYIWSNLHFFQRLQSNEVQEIQLKIQIEDI